ncbi:MAG: prolipoprotein diacylglyceryl transferase [Clostridia bacterium]|nr:prolipoprotein diacylglyceryl transferase [Clostridia bacterium]
MQFALLAREQPHISIFGFPIYAYAIIIVCGMAVAAVVIGLLFKRRNMSVDLFMTYFCITVPVAVITTRLFYCITDGMPIGEWLDFESIRQGGLSIIGGIIGGAASVLVISLVKKVNFFRAGDCIVVGLLLAQAIGRWGNFANQEVYGAEVTNPALQFFPISVYIEDNGAWHYAFFFYESMVTLTAGILLFINAWKNPYKPNGVNTACYFIVYGAVRSIMEPLRDSSYILQGGGVPWSLVFSILMLVAGIGLLVTLLALNKINEGKCIGSATGQKYAIAEYIKDSKKDVAYLDKINMMCKIYPEKYAEKPAKEIKAKKENDDVKK